MDQMNFHKLKLYALIIAGVAFVALLLPWISVSFLGASKSWNGLRGWGLLSLVGVIAVAVITLMGNKPDNYTAENKKFVMAAFGAIAVGALLFFLRKGSAAGSDSMFNDMVKTGMGLWLCLIAGAAGLALLNGMLKIETKKEV